MTLLSVNAVLEDAEDKQFTKPNVKKWLDELKDAVYDTEDIFDKIATKDLRRRVDAEFGTIASKVSNPISTSRFVKNVERKIEELLDRLDFLVKQKENIGLRDDVGGNPLERLPTTSLIEESNICGRNYDKEAIINFLFSNDVSDSEIGVIAIVGMGGIGKTTLAQLVYNDNRAKEHFELEVWVCVSDPFDVFMAMKTILEEVGSSTNADRKNLNQLQIKLKETLTSKKFLLVLDGVWDMNYAKWEVLSNALKYGAQGSKVIVTTRNFEVARVMQADVTHCLKELLKEDCWSLFSKYAFHNGNSDAYPKLEAIGRQVVKKCKGLPLAIKAIGALLWSKLDLDEWDKVLRSELWDLSIEETGILPALGLSYKYLSSHQKRCFAYCSIFPKDYAFKKNILILLWMAEGFLPQVKNKTMEEVGDDYFLALVSRSLFQQCNRNEYIMHDLVSDLAKFIYKQFALSHEDVCSREILSNTRHFSYSCRTLHIKEFEAFHKAKRLRTVLELNYDVAFVTNSAFVYRNSDVVSQFLLPVLRCLRVLSLSHYYCITELPYSIGKMIHLRYLDLSYTRIKRLPDSICELCNLQTLKLSHCTNFATFPRDMHKLINLRHLDITATLWIKEMPRHMGRLKCLQTLTKFIIGKHSGFCIGELEKLTNLRGSLSILELQNVESPTDAKDVNLRDRKYLEELVFNWKVDTNASENHMLVLDSLQPHSNLESLVIDGYGGKRFPNWIGHPSFSNISSLRLEYCNHCFSLPPLGQLASLEKLYVQDCPQVESFHESGLPSNLNEIYIYNCDKLFASRMRWGLQKLPFLRRFKICGKSKDLESFPEAGVLPTSLTYLRIEGFPNLKYLDKMGLRHLTALEELNIRDCPKLECMPEDEMPTSLSTLRIYECPLLKEEWQTKQGIEWRKIAHILNKYIDYKRIE
jgi:hypothetical protein